MTGPIDSRLLQQLDLMRDLGQLTITGAQALLGQQFACARGFVARNGARLKEGGPAAWQAGLEEAAEGTREASRLSALMQLQVMRLLERQSREAQALLAVAESVLVAALPGLAEAGSEVVPVRQPIAADAPPQRLAA